MNNKVARMQGMNDETRITEMMAGLGFETEC